MTMKEMFQKVEAYNEITVLMKSEKANIYFADMTSGFPIGGEHFNDYSDFRKFIRREYFKDVADKILKGDFWEIDGESEIITDAGRTLTFTAELSA